MEGINVTKKEKAQVNKVWSFFKKITPSREGILVVITSVILSIVVFGLISYFTNEAPQNSSLGDTEEGANENCSVVGINLHGSIITYVPQHAEGDTFFDYDVTSSEDVTWNIESANNDPDIKAILIEVDSGGGSPTAGEEIANAIKASKKPVIAFIRGVGASSAYWAISSADKIFASANSDVGSIGVTMSYLSNVEKNIKEGLVYEQITSGKYKDLGIPDKPLTAEDKAMLLRDVNIVYNNFVKAVAENRGLTIKVVKSFADGSSVLGEKAKELGMIDEIGGMTEAETYLEGVIGEKPEVCW